MYTQLEKHVHTNRKTCRHLEKLQRWKYPSLIHPKPETETSVKTKTCSPEWI